MWKPWTGLVLTGSLSLALAPPAHAAGPGLPNQDFPQNEVFTVIGRIDSTTGAPRAHGTLTMLDGYVLVVFSRDSGKGDGGFALIDVSDPKNPVGVLTKDDDETEDIREAHGFGMSRIDGRLYVALQASFGIQIWDFTDPLAPVLASYPKLPGITDSDYGTGAWWLSFQGDRIYVGGSSNGLYIVDVTDPKNPELVDRGGAPNPIPIGNLGSFKTGPVMAFGNLMAIFGMDQPGYATLDISDPDHPALLATKKDVSSIYSGVLNGNWLLGAGAAKNSVAVYDISDPLSIATVGEITGVGERGGYLSFQDGFAHIGASKNYAKVDIRNPDSFSIVGTATSGISGRDEDFTTVLGNLAFISDDHGNGSFIVPHQANRDLEPPRVNGVSPKHGAVGQNPKSRIGISFTDQLDFASVSESTVSVRVAGTTTPLSGRYSYFQNLVNFTPSAPLAPDTTYEIVVDKAGVKDVAGNPSADAFVALFSTGGVIDNPNCTITPKTPVVAGDSVTFQVATGVSGALSYEWDFGDGSPKAPETTSPSASHSFSDPGHYTVIAYVRDSGTLVTSCTLPQTVHLPIAPGTPTQSSTIVFDPASARVFAANPDHDSVTAIDAASSTRLWETPAGERPRSVAIAADGSLWVASDRSATITVHDSASGTLEKTLTLHPGSRPSALAPSPDGTLIYAALQGSGELIEIDVADRRVARTLAIGPSPRGLAVTGDGSQILVARFLSPLDHAEVSVVSAESFELERVEELVHDESPDTEASGRGVLNYLRSLSISPDGTSIFLGAKKDNTRRGPYNDGNDLTFESTVRAAVAKLALSGGEDPTQRVDLNDRALPSAVLTSPLGDLVFVATELTNTVEVLDAYTGSLVTSIQDLGRAPDGLALDPESKRLFVHSFLTREVHVLDVSGMLDNASSVVTSLGAVATTDGEVLPADVLLGKQLFYDAWDDRMSRDNYIACASCHLDGEHDGRTWDFFDRGEGLRNTATLIGKRGLGQGRLHWSANFDEVQDFEHDIRGAFEGTGFLATPDISDGPLGAPKAGQSPELDALAAYVSSLDRVNASPYREKSGAMTPDAVAGKQIFERLACGTCHSGDDLTNSADGNFYDVGTLTFASGYRLGETLEGLDTPTLVGLWETAPYLHDGSAPTLEAVLDRAAKTTLHGDVASLSEKERAQLVRYLLEIDDRAVTASEPAEESGCGCRVGGERSGKWPWEVLIAVVLGLAVRRWRWR